MRYLPIRTEKSVAEVIDKVYADLTPEKRASVEAALLRENPQLKTFSKVRRGTIVKIPTLEGVDETGKRSVADPVAELVELSLEELSRFSEELGASFSREEESLKEQSAIAKSAAFTRAMESDPEAVAIAEQLKKNLAQRTKDLKDRSKTTLDAVKALGDAIAKLER